MGARSNTASCPIPKVSSLKISRAGSNISNRWSRHSSMKKVLLSVSLAARLSAADIPYWIEPCTNPATSCLTADVDLARWSLEAWQEASGTRLHFVAASDQSHALLRLVWATPSQGLYGETVPIQ